MNKALLMVIVGISSLLCFSNSSFARNKVSVTGSYVEARLGTGGMDTPKSNKDTISVPYDYHLRNGISFGALIGYLWTTCYPFTYGLEAGYLQYPTNKYNFYNLTGLLKRQYKGNSFDVLAVGQYYFTKHFHLIGKIGAVYMRQKLLTGVNDSFSGNDEVMHKWNPELSVGIGYDFNKNVGLDLIFTHLEGNKPSAFFTTSDVRRYEDVASVNLLLLGLNYHFV